jgi:hypothetical protein
MIVQLQGSRMQISRSLSPRVETGTGNSTNREGATEMKSKTGEGIEKGRAERMAGTIDSDFFTRDSVSFCFKVSSPEVFCFVWWSAMLTAPGFYCSISRTRNYGRSPRRERECNS